MVTPSMTFTFCIHLLSYDISTYTHKHIHVHVRILLLLSCLF
jgi:hypothetical protein